MSYTSPEEIGSIWQIDPQNKRESYRKAIEDYAKKYGEPTHATVNPDDYSTLTETPGIITVAGTPESPCAPGHIIIWKKRGDDAE